MDKPEFMMVLHSLNSSSDDLNDVERLQLVCNLLVENIPHYPWVGIYVLRDGMLYLDAWQGPQPTEHTVIPVGKGICGMAVREERTIVVDDVKAEGEYLACFINTKSEIVVPIFSGEIVIGEIDIDGDEVGVFTDEDESFLKEVAEWVSVNLSE